MATIYNFNSSNLDSAEHDAASETLTITFTNGRRYRYDGVPADEVDRLFAAPSAGRYFAANIRDRYPYTAL